MSFIGNQKDSILDGISNIANSAVQSSFPTVRAVSANIVAASNTDILYVRGEGIVVSTNTNQRTLSIATTSDLRVSQNSAIMAANNWTLRLGPQNTLGMDVIQWIPELHLFVAMSTTTGAFTSPDGITWTQRSPVVSSIQGVTWSPELGLLVAVGLSGSSLTTPDGINWTTQTAVNNSWRGVTWSSSLGLFVAVSDLGADTSKQIMISSDGVNWGALPTPSAKAWQDVIWCKELGIFVAVGTSSIQASMTSPDGINWTYRSSEVFGNSIAWSPELGLFVASASIPYYSYDGINWTSTGINLGSVSTVIWVPQFRAFVSVGASGSNLVAISFDGITWIGLTAAASSFWGSVAWSPELGLLVAVARTANTTNLMTSRPVGLWGSINTRLTRSQVFSRISLGV